MTDIKYIETAHQAFGKKIKVDEKFYIEKDVEYGIEDKPNGEGYYIFAETQCVLFIMVNDIEIGVLFNNDVPEFRVEGEPPKNKLEVSYQSSFHDIYYNNAGLNVNDPDAQFDEGMWQFIEGQVEQAGLIGITTADAIAIQSVLHEYTPTLEKLGIKHELTDFMYKYDLNLHNATPAEEDWLHFDDVKNMDAIGYIRAIAA